MKKLSLITINYDNLLGLKLTVSSVLKSINMHRDAVEYIIIDGKSNDGSDLFLKKNRQKFNKLISQQLIKFKKPLKRSYVKTGEPSQHKFF